MNNHKIPYNPITTEAEEKKSTSLSFRILEFLKMYV
jgi:hypothetical protein